MTAPRDPDRLVRAFLEEGPDQLPDRSYDAVRSHIDRTRQRVVIGPWREPRMSNIARIAIAAAAVLVVAVLGYNFLPGNGGIGGPHPSPSPSPTLAPTPSPAATPGALALQLTGPLAPGTYYVDDDGHTKGAHMTMTVPAGWSTPASTDTLVIKNEGAPGEVEVGSWGELTHIFSDACKWDANSMVAVGTTVDQLVSALVVQKSRQASAPTDATLGGYLAKRLELTVSPTLDTATCSSGNLRYWPGPGPDLNSGLCCNPAGNTDLLYIVDVGGQRLVIVARYYPGSTAADKAEMQAIIDSIQIVP